MTDGSEPGFAGVVGRTIDESTPWWPEPRRAGPGTPDVVIVVLDDVGYGDLGCYGSEIATPTMDRLAAGGLRYTELHTTPLCSPTRASLLTGRDHHAVGVGMVADWDAGFPSSRSRITPAAATLAELLRDAGYATLAIGKWHLCPPHEMTQAGPFANWPLGKGFDRHYGYLAGFTDQYFPDLVRDNTIVEPPRRPEEGYHLTEDLIDNAIAMVRDHVALTPHRPFLLYTALGACHWPLQVPDAFAEPYRGRYDRGWDVLRQERFARQRELGVVPSSADLPPRNPGVPGWDELSDDERRFTARLQETYAGFLHHADHHLGRLVDELERAGRLDNTVFVLVSDNGASQEGGPSGYLQFSRFFNLLPPDVAEGVARLDEIGGPTVHPSYPWGWAQVSNTPLKRYKGHTFGGGVRDPFIVHWPAGIADAGGLRHQFHHISDLMPTILELVGLEAPTTHRGVPQLPVHGISFAYTFEGVDEPTRRHRQIFEVGGHRAIWADGWKAVAYHHMGLGFEHDVWELYHLDEDWSELHDLAAAEPERLAALIELWWQEAEAHGVLPLDDRMIERLAMLSPPGSPRGLSQLVLPHGTTRIPGIGVPWIANRSWSVTVDLARHDGDDGVLVSYGSVSGGIVLYVLDGHLCFEHDHGGDRTALSSADALPAGLGAGPASVGVRFDRTGILRGTATLHVDGRDVGTVVVPRTLGVMSAVSGLEIGADSSSPASPSYVAPFAFSGRIGEVRFDLADDGGTVTVHDLIAD